MGNCCAGDAGGKAKPAAAPRQMKRRSSVLSTTGIMDEVAPQTTAPKLEASRRDVQLAIARCTDILLGERYVIDSRIPASRSDARERYYEHLLLLIREAVQNDVNTNNSGGVIGVHLPSHVYELTALIKDRALRDSVLTFPTPATKRAVSCHALRLRKPLAERWLRALYDKSPDQGGIALPSLGALFKTAGQHSIAIPAAPLAEMEDFKYSEILKIASSYYEENLAPFRRLYQKHAVEGFLGLPGLQGFIAEYAVSEGCEGDFDVSKVFTHTLIEEDVRKVQGDMWSEQELFALVINPDGPYGGVRRRGKKVYQKMTQSLWDYSIFTTKNSHLLLRDIMTSDASHDMLKALLLSGHRCLELDISDGPEGEPCVYLAWTKSKRLPLSKCLSTIYENAFVASPYPVILRLHLHFGIEVDNVAQLTKTASYFKEYLHGSTVGWSADNVPPPADKFTPEGLKKKFVIISDRRDQEIAKEFRETPEIHSAGDAENIRLGMRVAGTKKQLGVCVVKVEEGSPSAGAGITEGSFINEIVVGSESVKIRTPEDVRDAFSRFLQNQEEEFKIVADQREHRLVVSNAGQQRLRANSVADDYSSDEENADVISRCKKAEIQSRIKSGHRPYKKCALDQQMSQLTTLIKRYYTTSAVKAGSLARRLSFIGAEGMASACSMPSYFEVAHVLQGQLDSAYTAAGIIGEESESPDSAELDALVQAAKTCLIHVQQNRRDSLYSENFCPIRAWEAGAQLVSVHPQRVDRHYRLHQALFRDNGNCGYVLKQHHADCTAKKLKLKVILAVGVKYSDASCVFAHFAGTEGNKDDVITRQHSAVSCASTTHTPWYASLEMSRPSKYNAWDHAFAIPIDVATDLACTVKVLRIGICAEPSDAESQVMDKLAQEKRSKTGSTASLAATAGEGVENDNLRPQSDERGLVAEICVPLHSLAPGLRSLPLYNPVDGKRINEAAVLCHIALE